MKIVVVTKLDAGANGVRSLRIRDYLQSLGHDVVLLDQADDAGSRPRPRLARALPVAVRNLLFLLSVATHSRGIERAIRAETPDAVIFEMEEFACCLMRSQKYITVLDSPTPWLLEWWYSGNLSRLLYSPLLRLERTMYSNCDMLTFHWDSYTSMVRESIYNGSNICSMNWACDRRERTAGYSPTPRIVYIGKLGGYWVNMPLLSRLSKQFPIDVYGLPKPSEHWGLNYRGYAADTDILADYQFGLITVSDDQLRRRGFSAKHLEYLSYGLPVLVPGWRRDPALDSCSIHYREDTFRDVIDAHSSRSSWEAASQRSLAFAKGHSWSSALEPLRSLLGP